MGVAAADSQFHVLAVDDSLIDRKLIERLLKISSFQVTTVDSGNKALEFLGWHEDDDEREHNCNETSVCPRNHQEVDVNLVITDYCMPGMTGFDLLKKMKECSYLRNIPVVIMSSENVPSRITRCLEEGAEEFFLKPVKLSDVNKLRPHIMTMMMKTKDLEKPEKQEKQENGNDKDEEKEQLPTEQSVQQQQNNSNGNNNISKRKSMDDGLPPLDRARPRYNGALTVMSN